jgi:glycosyltransferase involved in cell wall biosynthesis
MKAFWQRGRVLEMVDSSSAEADLIPVTAVIPVKNEEQSLPSCLAALDGFADIVVVDSGSTDATVAIAQEAGAKVIQFRWSGGFPKKRIGCCRHFRFAHVGSCSSMPTRSSRRRSRRNFALS